MKKTYYLFLMLFAALFAGCKNDDDTGDPVDKLFSFDIKNEKGFTAPKDDINSYYDAQVQYGMNFPLPVSGVASDTETQFRNNNTSTSLVTAVKVKEVFLTMPDNAKEDFTFLEKMDIYIAMDEQGTDAVLMAYNRNIANTPGMKKLVFTPTTNSMEKYVKAGTYALILKDTKLRRKVTEDLSIKAYITYTVTANPLK